MSKLPGQGIRPDLKALEERVLSLEKATASSFQAFNRVMEMTAQLQLQQAAFIKLLRQRLAQIDAVLSGDGVLWNPATITPEDLRAEVKRLTDELRMMAEAQAKQNEAATMDAIQQDAQERWAKEFGSQPTA